MQMLALLKHVLSKWHLLIVKMALDYASHPPSSALFHLLCDIESFLAMACIFYLRLCSP